MIFIVNAENRRLFEFELLEMHRQRKTIFVDRIGWRVPIVADMEIDQYDREDTTYLIAKTEASGPVLASARLLSTLGPHLMLDLFRDSSRSHTLRGPAIWEVSRFCAAPAVRSRRARINWLWEIICGVIETALLFGIERVTFAANAALLPLAIGCGWDATQLGPTMRDGDDEVTPVAVAITPEGLRNVRHRFRIGAPVTRFLTPATRLAA
jgi:acyl-homoserine lactone synthase